MDAPITFAACTQSSRYIFSSNSSRLLPLSGIDCLLIDSTGLFVFGACSHMSSDSNVYALVNIPADNDRYQSR